MNSAKSNQIFDQSIFEAAVLDARCSMAMHHALADINPGRSLEFKQQAEMVAMSLGARSFDGDFKLPANQNCPSLFDSSVALRNAFYSGVYQEGMRQSAEMAPFQHPEDDDSALDALESIAEVEKDDDFTPPSSASRFRP